MCSSPKNRSAYRSRARADLRLERQRRVVQRKLLQRLAEILVVRRIRPGTCREHACWIFAKPGTPECRMLASTIVVADRRGVDLANRREPGTRPSPARNSSRSVAEA